MRAEAQHGERYWSLVSPHLLELNEAWDQGVGTFVFKLHKAPLKVQHLYAAHWCQSEVYNSGLFQFFHNATGILAPEAVSGFEAIGAPELAEVLKQAMTYFGTPYRRDRTARFAKLPDPEGRPRTEWDPFGTLDRRFDKWIESDHYRWDKLADTYASDA
jgi:hypothetical protein